MGEPHRRDLYGGGTGRPDIVTREAKIVTPHPPLIEIAIEPKADQEKLGLALAQLAAEDPSFLVSTDQETGQTILKGMSELHLDRTVDSLASMFGYVSNLRSMSEGQATFAMRFDHYAEVPRATDDDPTFRPAIGMRP